MNASIFRLKRLAVYLHGSTLCLGEVAFLFARDMGSTKKVLKGMLECSRLLRIKTNLRWKASSQDTYGVIKVFH